MRQRGYTLAEVIAAVAITMILSGILTPVVVRQIAKAKIARAQSDVAALADALTSFRDDVKSFPDMVNGVTASDGYLLTAGTTPGGVSSWTGPSDLAKNHLQINDPTGADYGTTGDTAWRGPYLPNVPTDPWGRAYIISVAGMRGVSTAKGWILSAGPNGTLETDDGDSAIAATSDDIGWRLK